MNCERLNELALWLEAGAPETLGPGLADYDRLTFGDKVLGFNMRHWWSPQLGSVLNEGYGTACGSICCIGGTADAWWGREEREGANLGLDSRTAKKLFYPGSAGNGEGYNATPAQAARVIRHLMKTGEVDWSDQVMGAP